MMRIDGEVPDHSRVMYIGNKNVPTNPNATPASFSPFQVPEPVDDPTCVQLDKHSQPGTSEIRFASC
jgi:hypothetical protein